MEKARTRLQERSDGILYESKNKPLGKTKPSVLQSLDTMEATTIRQDVIVCLQDIDNILPRERSDAVMTRRNR